VAWEAIEAAVVKTIKKSRQPGPRRTRPTTARAGTPRVEDGQFLLVRALGAAFRHAVSLERKEQMTPTCVDVSPTHGPGADANLARVTGAIGPAVPFAAPASADRVLRDLRRRGHVLYRVVDRAASLYQVEGVTP
jgi:hypothetical protein